MKKHSLLLSILIFIPFFISSQNWYSTYGIESEYDSSMYLTGFGISTIEGKNQEGLKAAHVQALDDLASKIKTSIESECRISNSDFGDVKYESYESDIKSVVSLDLSGVEKYEEYYNKKENRYMALAVLNRKQMSEYLEVKILPITSELDALLQEAKDYQKRNREDLAKDKIAQIDVTLDILMQNVLIGEIVYPKKSHKLILDTYYQKRNELRSYIQTTELLSTADLIEYIVQAIDWMPYKSLNIVVLPATYMTTPISGEYFYYLANELQDSLKMKLGDKTTISTGMDDADIILKGSYFKTDSGYELIYKINDKVHKNIIGGVDVKLDKRFLGGIQMELIPDNIDIAVSDYDKMVSVHSEIKPTQLKVWTNKGDEGLIFKEGEILTFYVQSSRSGYISILYHLAGKNRLRVPLVENLYIPPSEIYKPIRLETDFVVAPPFGSETAQVFFSPNKIELFPVKESYIEGINYYVLAEDYDTFLVKTRGLVVANNKNVKQLEAETFVTITTIKDE